MFQRILVALDGSDDARAAFVFATDWSRHFDSQLWFIQLTQESHRARREIVTDVSQRGRQRANQFAVSGATRGQRNQQLVSGIVEAANTFGADLIIVGIDGRRLGRSRLAESFRAQLTAATNVPVLVGCKPCVSRTPARVRPSGVLALGPGTSEPVRADAVLAHV